MTEHKHKWRLINVDPVSKTANNEGPWILYFRWQCKCNASKDTISRFSIIALKEGIKV